MDSRISNEENVRFTQISTETSSRISADDSLAAAISAINFADFNRNTYTGSIDGSNNTFTFTHEMIAGSEFVYINGVLLENGSDYNTSTGVVGISSISFFPTNLPKPGDKLTIAGQIIA